MTKSEIAAPIKNERIRANRARISPWQQSIEHHAMRLRTELVLSDLDSLAHEHALSLIPNCEIWALKNVSRLPYEHVVHFRTEGFKFGAMAFRDADGDLMIVFNDAHPPADVRVHLMEEFFHIRLGHLPDAIRLYPQNGKHRTHDYAKEEEAYGSGIAALVPYGGLEAMLARGVHIARIAEHFGVPVSVIEHRISVTRLEHLMSSPQTQLSLLTSTYA